MCYTTQNLFWKTCCLHNHYWKLFFFQISKYIENPLILASKILRTTDFTYVLIRVKSFAFRKCFFLKQCMFAQCCLNITATSAKIKIIGLQRNSTLLTSFKNLWQQMLRSPYCNWRSDPNVTNVESGCSKMAYGCKSSPARMEKKHNRQSSK